MRDFSTLKNLNMFVSANICDCALLKTVYDRSIDRKHVCVMLDMVDFFVKYKHV